MPIVCIGEALVKRPLSKKTKKLLSTAALILLNVGIIAWTAYTEFSGTRDAPGLQ